MGDAWKSSNKGGPETPLQDNQEQQKGSKCLLFLGAFPSASSERDGPFMLMLCSYKPGDFCGNSDLFLVPLCVPSVCTAEPHTQKKKERKISKKDFGHIDLHTAATAEGLLRLLLKPFQKLLML